MGKVIFNMTMSLDGFIAGPNDQVERLFKWYFGDDTEVKLPGSPVLMVSAESAKLLKESVEDSGAMVTGRRTFNVAEGWGGNPPIAPCVVLTHTLPQEWDKEGSHFIFVTDGIESAIHQAKKAAGDKDVVVSTASTLQQCLNAGLLDEIQIDLAPILLTSGVRLFDHLNIKPIDLEIIRTIAAPGVTHLGYRVVK